MRRHRTKWNKATKFTVALAAYKGDRSVTDIAEEYGVHPTQVHRWKKELMEHGPDIFAGKNDDDRHEVEAERDALYRKVGHQQVQIDFLKKKTGSRSVAELQEMIEPDHRHLSIREQCMLLGLHRSTVYYRPHGESEAVIALMRRIDEMHTAHITWGSRKIRDALRLEGVVVNRKRVQRLMRRMGLRVVFPHQHHRRLPPDHEVYPYLLRGISVSRPNQVWSIDLPYIRLADGFVYLTAIIDWYSRKILAWDLSLTMDKSSAIEVLDRAMRRYGAPEIFNSDQGVQFTSPAFLQPLKDARVKISMDGKGRALDNVIIERFWRTIKYDEVYLNDYESPTRARQRIGEYIAMYNGRRPHSSIRGNTPNMAYAAHAARTAA